MPASYLPRVTTPDPALPTDRREVARELLGVLLVLIGSVGLVVAAAHVSPYLALAVGSLCLVAWGVRLSMTTVSEE